MRIAGNSDWKGEIQGWGWGMRMGSYIQILSSEFDLYSVGMNELIIDEIGVSQRIGTVRCPYWLSIETCASDRSSRTYPFQARFCYLLSIKLHMYTTFKCF